MSTFLLQTRHCNSYYQLASCYQVNQVQLDYAVEQSSPIAPTEPRQYCILCYRNSVLILTIQSGPAVLRTMYIVQMSRDKSDGCLTSQCKTHKSLSYECTLGNTPPLHLHFLSLSDSPMKEIREEAQTNEGEREREVLGMERDRTGDVI